MDDGELVRSWAAAVRAVSAVQQSAAEEIESLGIPFAYFSVLSLLMSAEDHRLPMSRIARDLSMTSGGFTKLADRMARDGYIDRRGSSGDRRVVFAALTDAGYEVGRRADASYREVLRKRVLEVLDAEQVRDMAKTADHVYEANRGTEEDGAWQVTSRPEDAPDRRGGGERGSDEQDDEPDDEPGDEAPAS
jgi:DNA-binding MarR family transcriptional regulator